MHNLLANYIENKNKYDEGGISHIKCRSCKKIIRGNDKARFTEQIRMYSFPHVHKSNYAANLIKNKHTIRNMDEDMKTHKL